MAKMFFVKELISNPLILEGRKIPFEDLGDEMGGIVTEDPVLAASLRHAQRTRIGGVYEVTEEQFADHKKKAIEHESLRNSRALANNIGGPLQPLNKPVDAAVAGNIEQTPIQSETFRVPIPTTKVPIGAPLSDSEKIPPAPARRPATRRLSQLAPDRADSEATVSTP